MAIGPARDAVEAGEEHVRDRLVAVHVHREVDAGPVHRRAGVEDLGAALQARRMPLAVEVHARGVGPQVAAARAVRVQVGNDVEGRRSPERAGDRIVRVGQPVQRALHPPFGHRLAGVLAGVKPYLARTAG